MSESATEAKIRELSRQLKNEKPLVSQVRWCEVHLIRVDRRDGDMCGVARRIARSGGTPLACCMVKGWWVIREVCE